MIIIDVQVNGGVLPIPIKVFIDNIDNSDDFRFTRTTSFNEHVALAKGRYMLTISGMNPDEGHTIMKITGDFSEKPTPAAEQRGDKRFFSKLFYFEI